MAALTANIQRPVKPVGGHLSPVILPLAGATGAGAAFTVFKGAILVCDASAFDGYFKSHDITEAVGDFFGGIAAEKAVVAATDTANGSKQVSAYQNGWWGFAKGAITRAALGALAYASDDNTISLTSTDNLLIGRIMDVDGTYVWVKIDDHVMVPMESIA